MAFREIKTLRALDEHGGRGNHRVAAKCFQGHSPMAGESLASIKGENLLTVTILNWEEFNPRKDVKRSSWFRMEHSLFDHPDFFSFTNNEILAWVYILCIASRQNSSTIRINYMHAERIGRIKAREMDVAVQKLSEIGCISIGVTHTSRPRHAYDTHTYATNERTNERDERDERDIAQAAPKVAERHEFNFEALYQKYPRKVGKQAGMKTCKAQVRTEVDYLLLENAIERYKKHIAREATEPRFIKHFSSFMTSWRDWLDPDAGKVEQPVIEEPEWKKQARAEEAQRRANGSI